jgi:hypothetical protein
MDQTQLQQNIAKYYAKLPVELQQFFSDMKWMDDLKDISTKYSLTEEQITTLGTETTLLLLGIVHKDEYKDTLEKDLNSSNDIFNNIFSEIETSVLKDIYIQLDEAFTINVDLLLEEKYGGDKKLDERFNELPKEVQLAINESNYQVALYAIANKYKLNIEQMGILEELTTKVMLGIINPDNYENELSSNIKIPKEDISNIINNVNEEVLKTIRELLKKHWNDNQQIDGEKIPLPPYAVLEIKQNDTLKKIEAIGTSEKKSELENIPKNIFEEKLSSSTTSSHVVSDYSSASKNTLPSKDNNLNSSPKSPDPYREEF